MTEIDAKKRPFVRLTPAEVEERFGKDDGHSPVPADVYPSVTTLPIQYRNAITKLTGAKSA
ncbi:hypothetical protein ABIC83_004956 [Roseateles asaccharophilus]